VVSTVKLSDHFLIPAHARITRWYMCVWSTATLQKNRF